MKKTLPAVLAALLAGQAVVAQQPKPSAPKRDAKADMKAEAYYHYALGHLYAELAGSYGNRGDYVTKAVESYRQALQADPDSSYLAEELSDLYIQSGKYRSAISDAEEALRQNPNDLGSRRVLGRIYTRLIADTQQNRMDEEMLKKALEQYQKISAALPNDVGTWLMLGRLYKVAQNSVDAEKAYNKALALDANNEDAMTGLALVYGDQGDQKKASEMLERVVGKNPSLRTLTALASSYENMKDFANAASTLRRAADLAPGNAELKRALAQNLLFADKTDEALKLYEELAEQEPRDAQTQLRLSQVYRQKRDFAKARAASQRARELDANNLEVQYNEVSLLEAEGKNKEAIQVLKDILDKGAKGTYSQGEKSNRIIFLERLGLLYRANDQHEEAAQTFRQIGEVNPELGSRATAQVIDTYRAARNYAKAQAEADAAVQKYPEDRTIRVVRASLMAENGKAAQAATDLKKLLDGKNDRETWLTIAQVYDKAKDYNEMTKALDSAEKLSIQKEEKEAVMFMRGAMLERRKKFDAAEAEFRKVLEANPDNASALNYLGYMLADRNVRLPEAQQMISKALQLDPDNAAYLDSLGWVYYRQGKLDEAESSLRRAIEKYAKDPTVHDHLGDVYLKQGKLKEAIGQWESSVREYESAAASERETVDIASIQKKLETARVRLSKEGPPANSKQP